MNLNQFERSCKITNLGRLARGQLKLTDFNRQRLEKYFDEAEAKYHARTGG
jgi:hypothetical protein